MNGPSPWHRRLASTWLHVILAAVVLLTVAGIYLPHHDATTQQPVLAHFYPSTEINHGYENPPLPTPNDINLRLGVDVINYFEDYPLIDPSHGGEKELPYSKYFGKLGQRTALLADLLEAALNQSSNETQQQGLLTTVDKGAALLYPFLNDAPKISPLHGDGNGLSTLRASFVPGSAGIVIPVGNFNLRHAAHLITSLRHMLRSRLPIQIAYAGDADLSPENRAFLERAAAAADDAGHQSPPPVEFLNIRTVFNDKTLRLRQGSWAIKPFALLASRFETVILLNADTVFVQQPEVLLSQTALQRSGMLLFHDRFIEQKQQALMQQRQQGRDHQLARHAAWVKTQIKRPSEILRSSRAWTGSSSTKREEPSSGNKVPDAGEQGDAGVVVLDKSRPRVLMALLHTCWQNSYAVRQHLETQGLLVLESAHTLIGGGDKESWWLGLELTGAAYEMEAQYGAIVGWPREALLPGDADAKVCSSSSYQGLAHLDEDGRLLWYGGGLVKNMRLAKSGYRVPTAWMVGGQWRLGFELDDAHCMVGTEKHDLSAEEKKILRLSMKAAKAVDDLLGIKAK